MSEALVCLTEPFYSQDLCKDSCLHFSKFPNAQKSEIEQDTESALGSQDENKCSSNCLLPSEMPARGILPRKREASNILLECVKRRDNSRNNSLCSDVPCRSFGCDSTNILVESSPSLFSCTMELSDSSVTDSGIESSKNSSPTHSFDTSSPCHQEDDSCQHVMDVDTSSAKSVACVKDDSKPIVQEDPNSTEAFAVEDLNCLHLSDTVTLPAKSPAINSVKSPIIQSLFKNMPSVIYFPAKDEVVSVLPEPLLQLLKWKLSSITPVVVKQAILKVGFKLVEADTTEDWIGTWGKHLKCAMFKRIQNFQKVNHYPGGFHLGRKDRLWQNYSKMVNKHGDHVFNFFPETYILPADLKSLKEAWEKNEKEKCWIIKPCASARGCGVKVIFKWSQVPKNKPFVIQRYISDPYLIDGSKFDLRLYAMVSSIEPLRVYVFDDGLVRFASEKYSLANKSFSNRFIHLTNYSINKKSSTYTSNDDENTCQGHKWSLKAFWSYMSNSGIDVVKIQSTIIDMIIKTVMCTEGPICRLLKNNAKSSYNCFELFGFDVMLDKDLHPWLLEVNISPSLHTKSLLDSKIKAPLVRDMLNIAGFEVNGPLDTFVDSNRHKPFQQRCLSAEEKNKHALYTYQYSDVDSDILKNLTPDDLSCLMESEDELQRCGSFVRIFPTHDTHRYFEYFDHIRYYNVLLDAWERTYHRNREDGIKILNEENEKLPFKENRGASDQNRSDPPRTSAEDL